jgi:hypothetical protein
MRFCTEVRAGKLPTPDVPPVDSPEFRYWCEMYWKHKMNPGTRDPFWGAYRKEIAEVARRISSL